jgi:Protein of unknown function (DUF3467)
MSDTTATGNRSEATSPSEAGTRAKLGAAVSGQPVATSPGEAGTRLKVDSSGLTSSYCNVCNASSTREEVVLNFGVNEDWDRGTKTADVRMLHRIILSPFAAKRVAQLLTSLLKEYETRHGELK